MNTITVDEIEKSFKLVVEKLRIQEKVTKIEIEQDLYRFIPTDNWESFDQEALVGSLQDDAEELKKSLDVKDPVISNVNIDRLAWILLYTSEKLTKMQ